MNYKYNEREYAKVIKDKGFQTRFIRYELVVLVKYLKELGYTKKDTEKYLYEFCEKYGEGYNEVKYYKVIDKAIRDGRKQDNNLIVVKDLPITNSELSYIDNLDIDTQYKKLLLSFLVRRKIAYEINKIHNKNNVRLSAYFYGTNKSFREVFKFANIKTKGYKIDDMIANLVKWGIVESVVKGDIILSYMYNMYDTKTECIEMKNKTLKENEEQESKYIDYKVDKQDIFYRLNDFENVGYLFDLYKGDTKIKVCSVESCNSLFRANSNRQKFCKPCWKEKRKSDINENAKKYYKNNKNR